MKIRISSNNSLAIYEQIVNQIKDAVIKRELVENEALPSIRTLAKDLQISVITTKRAYEELEKEGVIRSVAGKGFYVCESNTEILKEKQAVMLEKRLIPIIKDSKSAEIGLDDFIDMIKILYETTD